MGIPGFNTWFSQKNKDAYIPLKNVQCSHLYVDMNSILHTCLRNYTYEKFHCLLHKRLDAIMQSVQPAKSVMLAIDGPAPLAKVLTQRERRKKSFSTEQRKSGNQQQKKKKKRKQQVVSSTALTPGTPWMHDICVSVLYYVSCRLTNRKWQHLEFEVSGPTVPGEGEVKILGRLARPRSQDSVGPADTHVIVGDDADLILMALVSMTPHLHILNTALSDHKLSLATPVLSVDHLHTSWLAKGLVRRAAAAASAASAASGPVPQGQQQLSQDVLVRLLGVKSDLALLAIMCSGNDYLPAVREAIKLDALWSSYLRIRKQPKFADSSIVTMTVLPPSSSSSNGSGSSPGAGRQLAVTAEVDTVMLSQVLDATIHGASSDVPQLQQQQGQQGQSPDAANGGGSSSSSSNRIGLSQQAAAAVPWLKGALWTMTMYFAGDCPDYRYSHKGGGASVEGLHQLAAAAAALSTASQHHKLSLSSFSQGGADGAVPGSKGSDPDGPNAQIMAWRAAIAAAAAQLGAAAGPRTDPMLPHVCSLALLPAGAQEHVPAAVQHLMDARSPIYDMYESCEGCELVADASYEAQMKYNGVLYQFRQAEAQLQGLEQLRDQPPPPPELLAELQALTEAKAQALAELHEAHAKRKLHEVEEHPNGLDCFDLDRLEAAVDSVPNSAYVGNQRALSELSHSMLLRLVRNSSREMQGMGYNQQQQQQYQHQQQHSQQRFGQQYLQYGTAAGSRGAPRPFKPPPPPVARFGPALQRSFGQVIHRSVLVESAYLCEEREDSDLWRYSNYLVLGTPMEAAAAAAGGSDGNKAAGEAVVGADGRTGLGEVATHKRRHSEQQLQVAAMVSAAQRAAADAAEAVSTAQAALSRSSLKTGQQPRQQQSQQQPSQQQQQSLDTSGGPCNPASNSDSSGGGAKEHKQRRRKQGRSKSQQQLAGGIGSSTAEGRRAQAAAAQLAPGLLPAPAPQKLPMPSGLLNRAAGASGSSSSSMGGMAGRSAAAAAAGLHMLPLPLQQQQQPWYSSPAPGYANYQGQQQYYSNGTGDAYSGYGSSPYRPLQAPQPASMQLPLPAAPPLPALAPSQYRLPGSQQYFQQQQQRTYQVVRPVGAGYMTAPGEGGSAAAVGGLQGLPYNPMRPSSPALAVVPAQTGAMAGGAAAVWGSGMAAGRPPYAGWM